MRKRWTTAALVGIAMALGGVVPARAAVDTTPPVLVSVDASPGVVTTDQGPAVITLTVRVQDDLSGLGTGILYWLNPSLSVEKFAGFHAADRISGTATDGVYRTTLTLPQYSEDGLWKPYIVYLDDPTGNYVSSQDPTVLALMPSIEVSGGTDAPPAAPTAVTATPGDRTAAVTWTAPTDTGGSTITSYTVTASPGGASTTVSAPSPGAAVPTSATLTGLTNGLDHTITVTATNAQGSGSASTPSAAVRPRPLVAVTGDTAVEGSRSLPFTVNLTNPSTLPVTVTAKTGGGTAKAALDYTATTVKITVPAGATTASGTVPVVDDALHEKAETVVVTPSAPVNAVLASPAKGTATITDDDAAPVLTVADASVVEGDSGTAMLTFTATLSAISGAPATVTYKTANQTATAGSDYTATSGTLTIPAGQTTALIAVPVLGDTAPEGDETFLLKLSAPKEVTLARAAATGTIRTDDTASAADLSVTIEDADTAVATGDEVRATLRISNAGPSAAPVTLTVSASGAGIGYVSHPSTPVPMSCVTLRSTSSLSESCTLGTIVAGGELVLPVRWAASAPGTLTWTAAVTSTTPDPTPSTATSSATITGPTCTILGSQSADSLLGTAGDDVVCGFAGNDTLDGRAGDDVLLGGPGTDLVTYAASPAGVNADLLAGTATGWGTDTLAGLEDLTGSAYADKLRGDAGPNTITGLGGADQLGGWDGDDTVVGGDGNDEIRLKTGRDSADGGAGVDTILFDAATAGVTVNLASGRASNEGTKTLTGIENVTGSAYADAITGDSGANVLKGGDGNDTIGAVDGTSGNDRVDGGGGSADACTADPGDVVTGCP